MPSLQGRLTALPAIKCGGRWSSHRRSRSMCRRMRHDGRHKATATNVIAAIATYRSTACLIETVAEVHRLLPALPGPLRAHALPPPGHGTRRRAGHPATLARDAAARPPQLGSARLVSGVGLGIVAQASPVDPCWLPPWGGGRLQEAADRAEGPADARDLVAGRIFSATTSVRDCVVPPARKKRRRMRR